MTPQSHFAARLLRKVSKNINNALYTSQWQTMKQPELYKLLEVLREQSSNIMLQEIQVSYPEHVCLPDARDKPKDRYVWYWDLLPETNNFIRRIEHLSLALSCCYKNQVMFAVICDPINKRECIVDNGKGVFCDGVRARVSSQGDLH